MSFRVTNLFLFFFLWGSQICFSFSIDIPSEYSILGNDIDLFSSEREALGHFRLWQKENGRRYENPKDEAKRFEIFQTNLKYISEMNAKRKSPYGARFGLNPFADMSHEEFRAIYLYDMGVNVTNELDILEMKEEESWENAPASLDWRKKGVVTRVKNQNACGSCWAFAATGAIEAANAIATGKLVSLSEQQLVDCDKKSHGCHGGWYFNSFEWVIKNGGIDIEDDYPYTAQDGICDPNKVPKNVVTIDGYKNATKFSEKSLFCSVAKQPVSVALDARDFQFYQSGIYDGANCTGAEDLSTTHAVLIVGYDSIDGEDYWIVKNSWGVDWGMKGYIFIKRNIGLPTSLAIQKFEDQLPITVFVTSKPR
ncbi:hypothetical protein L6164_017453 [Bauhinia variegata]|uniref:Uncharacterized protein n=1 Tax=Bauhinia variegata TaxID=167791 RepID=A0ACB9N860_BAUVA|nr:hypothetical protein L6164_017453 [Bauhinia variegata]